MIRKLTKQTINKIAAGEVIQRPTNVIKQLVQNSIDGGALHIRVSIIQGGLQSIIIVDNGRGISVEDFPLLCQRFATSKLSEMDDLLKIGSFGFRGQALASLSYVSNLQIQSRNKEEELGHVCGFRDQKMLDQPDVKTMNVGTKIIATNLFGNLETRRASLDANSEKKRIIKLLSHFALQYNTIRFSFQSQKGNEFNSDYKNCKHSQAKMKIFQLITKLPFDKFSYLQKQTLESLSIEAIITKLNTTKGKTLLLNVNNRIVQNNEIFKMVQKAYAECYQSIHQDNQNFYVYLSLTLDPKKIDCNVHPSKKTIGFFGAQKIHEEVYRWILDHIKEESSIKNISTNASTKNKLSFNINKEILVRFSQKEEQKEQQVKDNKEEKVEKIEKSKSIASKPVYDYDKSRNDSKQMPINFYLKNGQQNVQKDRFLFSHILSFEHNLQDEKIKDFFKKITYVGCFNLNYIFVQIDKRLLLLNILPFIDSYIIESTKNNPLYLQKIENPKDVRSIVQPFLKKMGKEEEDVEHVLNYVLDHRQNIKKAYGINIELCGNQGTITEFAVLQKFMGDCLDQQQLAYFLCRIAMKNPSQRQAQMYLIEFLATLFKEQTVKQQGKQPELSPMNDKYSEYMRDKVIPLLKTKCKHYKSFQVEKYYNQILDLKDVYKIFQRC